MKNKVFVILVNYNSYEDTEACIESLLNSNKDLFDLQIIVVDNNSRVTIKQELSSFCSKNNILFIQNKENFGFAKANNIGINTIKSQCDDNSYIWFLNNDTKVNPELLTAIKNCLPSEKQVLYFEMRNFKDEFVNDGLNYIDLFTGKYSELKKKKSEPYIVGASIFLKWCIDFPFWNEDYFLYFEDVDYSFSLKDKGYKFIKTPDVYYQHKINASSGKNSKTVFFRLKSQKLFMKKYAKSFCFFMIMKFFYLLFQGRIKELLFFVNCKVSSRSK